MTNDRQDGLLFLLHTHPNYSIISSFLDHFVDLRSSSTLGTEGISV